MSSRPNRVPGTFAQPRIMYVLPAIDDDLEPDVKNALAIRNACATEGLGIRRDADALPSGERTYVRVEDRFMSERLLDAQEVAERLHVPVSWVRESTRSGAMPCVELGRYRR